MVEPIAVNPIGPFSAAIRPPGSKSLTNRALLLAALADGDTVLNGALDADDTRHMLKALDSIGIEITSDMDTGEGVGQLLRVHGCAGRLPGGHDDIDIHVGNAGTAIRFLCAACCLGQGVYALDGIPRMRERPIGQLVDLLRKIGGKIEYTGADGFPPVRIKGTTLAGGELDMTNVLSSQYISALLQIAPLCDQGISLNFSGDVPSRPYIEMTLRLMNRFGVQGDVEHGWRRISIAPGGYHRTEYTIEPDASNASYFLAAAAVRPGSKCTINGLGKSSLQGDVGFADVLASMGAGLVFGDDFITVMSPPGSEQLRGIDVDLNSMPDMAQTLAVVALFAKGQTVIRNVGNLRIKETDRMAALEVELTKLGAQVVIDNDDIAITPPPGNTLTPAAIDTYDDHRMAMSFSVAGVVTPGVVINDPNCVNKTYPRFFDDLSLLGKSG